MANTVDDFFVWDENPEPKDDKIERLSRESERKSILLKMQKCKKLDDFRQLQKEIEESIQ